MTVTAKNRRLPLMVAALLLGWLWTGCDNATAPSQTAPIAADSISYEGVIVALGDSLSAGYGLDPDQAYPALLQQKLKQEGLDYQVVNAGVSGETSAGCRSRIDWVLRLKPDIVILEIGANDGMRGIDPTVTRQNIEVLIQRLEAAGVTIILAGMRMLPNLGVQFTDAFDALYPSLAEAHEVIFMPFFLEGVAGVAALNQPDGIHPTAQGYAAVVNNLWPHVETAIAAHQQRRTP